jgi:hypothetical protein
MRWRSGFDPTVFEASDAAGPGSSLEAANRGKLQQL